MSDRSERAKSIFLEALDRHTPEQWPAFVAEACAGDDDLRAGVEKLLRARAEMGSFHEQPQTRSPTTVDEAPVSERPGTMIGAYKLLEQIGEGGFGVVFLAEQTQPIRRKVALKVLKAGMDTRQVIARFEAERQALALMDHPNIARVLDAGTIGNEPEALATGTAGTHPVAYASGSSGRPYFVMELVKGLPITDYCNHARLPPRERLELFVDVCSAVQHAHQKGIIHRDLKPSNVLVTQQDGKPLVKVIDFGIAKALGQQLTDKTLFTGFAQMIGTPLYMSPEQAALSNVDVDTRSDVYSLGVLLYELLTGTTPFTRERLQQADYDEMRRIIREEEPPKPSQLRIADGRGLRIPKSKGRFRFFNPQSAIRNPQWNELDWIVMKALEKDRNRRYESANSFAADVQRYLANEPVQAGPASARYRLGKFVRRHRGPVVATGVVVVVLLAGVAVSTWLAIRATRSEASARRSAETTRAINRYLIEDLFAAANPEESRGRKLTVEEVLDRAAVKIDTAFPDQPEVEAGVRLAIGETYVSLSQYAKAEPHLRRALDLRNRHLGAGHLDTLEAMRQLGWLCAYQGHYDEAEQYQRQALDGFRRIQGREHRNTLDQMFNLAWVLGERGQYDRAEALFRECLEIQLRVLGEEHSDTLDTLDKLAQQMIHQKRWREAEPVARRCLEIKLRVHGKNDPSTLDARRTVALVLDTKGNWQEAERLYRENLAAARLIYPPNHRETLSFQRELGWLCFRLGRYSEAEQKLRECRDGYRQILGAEHELTLGTSGRLALALAACGRLEEAERQARETLKVQRRVKGPAYLGILAALARLGKVLAARGQWTEADACFQQAEEGFRRAKGLDNAASLVRIMHDRAVILLALGRHEEARSRFWRVLDSQRQALPADHPDLAEPLQSCGEYLLDVGQAQQAKTFLEEALRIQRAALPGQHPAIGQSLVALGWAHTRAGQTTEGEQLLRDGLAIARKALPSGHWFPAEAEGRLGDCLTMLKRFDEAEPLLLSSYKELQAAAGTPPGRRIEALRRIAHFYDRTGAKEKAAIWRLKLAAEKKP
jgi:serine/threonine protein kinase/Tfp pilus assembly protein PilF